jgi:uncharacterized membrane protein YgcG
MSAMSQLSNSIFRMNFFNFSRIATFTVVLILSLPVFSQSAININERITRFHSTMRVQKDCSVEITERISVVSRGLEIRHGIVRSMPLSYEYEGGRTDVGFTITEVKLDGQSEDYHTESTGNGILIYIGSESTLVSDGYHTFELTYIVEHVLGFFKKYDELYWNVNGTDSGTDSRFETDTVSAEIYYPEGARFVQSKGYTGVYGSTVQNYISRPLENGMYFQTTKGLAPGENLSVAVAWEKGHLNYPTGFDNFLYWIKSHFLWVIGAIGLLMTLIFNIRIWFRHGRDPKPGTIMPLYEAPKGFTPADAAFLHNYGRKTANMFTGQLIALATKGYLKIAIDEGGMFSGTTYTITKTSPVAGRNTKLLPLEEAFYSDLLGYQDSIVLKKGAYNQHLKDAQDKLIADVSEKQCETYILKRTRYKMQSYILPVIFFLAGLAGWGVFGGMLAISIVAFALCVILNLVFGFLFEQPTAIGRKTLDELAGYKMYMQYADKERIRLMNPPTMNFEHFEANLPYAIALGVADKWSQKFDQAELERGMSTGHYWMTGMMMHHMMRSFDFSDMTTTISSASTPPSKSASGSGGGGFSGGGGGGGGVGGW